MEGYWIVFVLVVSIIFIASWVYEISQKVRTLEVHIGRMNETAKYQQDDIDRMEREIERLRDQVASLTKGE